MESGGIPGKSGISFHRIARNRHPGRFAAAKSDSDSILEFPP